MSETTDLLAKVPLLSSLDQKQLERLARDFSVRTFPAGSVVVREGDTHGMGFFVVAEGEGVVTVGGGAAISGRSRSSATGSAPRP